MGGTLSEASVTAPFWPHFVVTPWEPDRTREGGTHPVKNKLSNSGTWHCITFTLYIYDHIRVPIKRWCDTNNSQQYITNKIIWPPLSSCVPLGKDIVGYFEPGGWHDGDGWSSQAIYQSHLSAARREELWRSFTLPPGLSPARENESRAELGTTCERAELSWGSARKNVTVLPRSVAEPASLAFGSSTTT